MYLFMNLIVVWLGYRLYIEAYLYEIISYFFLLMKIDMMYIASYKMDMSTDIIDIIAFLRHVYLFLYISIHTGFTWIEKKIK